MKWSEMYINMLSGWWLVYLPLWKMMEWVRQLGWWHSQLNGTSFKIPWFQSPPTSHHHHHSHPPTVGIWTSWIWIYINMNSEVVIIYPDMYISIWIIWITAYQYKPIINHINIDDITQYLTNYYPYIPTTFDKTILSHVYSMFIPCLSH